MKDNRLLSYDSYDAVAQLDRISEQMPSQSTIERASSIISEAIMHQFKLIDKGDFIDIDFNQAFRLLFLQAYAQLLDEDGKCERTLQQM